MTENKKGSIVLESTIVFTAFLVFIVSVITIIDLNRTNMLMQAAVEETCEKLQILPPLRIPLQDSISTVLNALPESINSSEVVTKSVSGLSSLLLSVNNSSDNRLLDILYSETFNQYVTGDIANEYISMNNGNDFFMPDNISTELDINADSNYIELIVTYNKLTIVGDIERKIYSVIPMYGDFDLDLYDSDDVLRGEVDDDIWNQDNFTRGLVLRERFGANLPALFPTIDTYNDGLVTSITTIDTTSVLYGRRNSLNIKLISEINALSEFKGAETTINGTYYCVSGDEITDRVLMVILPENDRYLDDNELYNSIIEYGDEREVEVQIIRYGHSSKYEEN